jgi:hypothetical protein
MVCRKVVKPGGRCKVYRSCVLPCRAQCPVRFVDINVPCDEWTYEPDVTPPSTLVEVRKPNELSTTSSIISTANVPSMVAAVTISSTSVLLSPTTGVSLSLDANVRPDGATLNVKLGTEESTSLAAYSSMEFGTHLGHWIAVFLAVIFAVLMTLMLCSISVKLYGCFNQWLDKRDVRRNRDRGKKLGYENVDETTPKQRLQYQQQEKDPTVVDVQQEVRNQMWRNQIEANKRRLQEREEEKRRQEIEEDNETARRNQAAIFRKLIELRNEEDLRRQKEEMEKKRWEESDNRAMVVTSFGTHPTE